MNKMLHGFKQKAVKNKSTRNWLCRQILLLTILFASFNPGELNAQVIPNIDGNPIDWNRGTPTSNFNLFPVKLYQLDDFGNGVVDNQFTEGSKDFFFANQLVWSISQTKAKNDIANAAAIIHNGVLYFAGDRTSNNGSAQIGFWLYLNGTGPTVENGNNTFTPPHADGDVFILADFTSGGREANVTLYQWDASGNGNVVGSNGNLRTTTLSGTVAQNNTGTYNVPTGWMFEQTTYANNMFYEGKVDLTDLGILDICKTSLLLETRSSHELGASLDDFVAGSFNVTPTVKVNSEMVCADKLPVTITATSLDGTPNQFNYKWSVPVGASNPGNVASFPASVAGTYTVVIARKGLECPSEPAMGTLTVMSGTTSSQSRSICSNQLPFTWDGLTFVEAGTKTKTGLTNAAGCDSTATYVLKVNPTTSSRQEKTICKNELPFTWDGLTFTEAGTKTKTGLTNAAGCDSTATYVLKVNPTTSSRQEKTICKNELPFTWDGLTFTEAGTKTKTGLTNAAGCDSTATYVLKVNPTTSSRQEKTICKNELPFKWDGLTFTEAGTQVKDGLKNQYGCDSTATYVLKVNPTTSSRQEKTICKNELPFTWDGLTFTEAGTKTKTGLTNAAGCDSTATYVLKVNPTTSSRQEKTICKNELPFKWDGLTFTEAGTQVKDGLKNQYGCDSTATYVLKVNPTTSSRQEKTICTNELPFKWDGLTFTEAGTQVKDGLKNQYGCDSTATYVLKVNPTTSSRQEKTICNNELPFTWDGLTFTEAGTKTKTGLTNAAGCDSTATYVLKVNPTTSSRQEKTICKNELPFTWDGLTFTEAGTKTKTGLTNAAGCDSTATYVLKVNPTTSSRQEKTICKNELPFKWDGLTFTEAGTQVKDGLKNQYGCDSTAIYNLTVNPLPIVSCSVNPEIVDITSKDHSSQLDVDLSGNTDTDPTHYSYAWSHNGNGSLSADNIKNPVYTAVLLDAVELFIEVTVTVTNIRTGCKSSSTCKIKVTAALLCPQIPTSEICAGSTNLYTASRAVSGNEIWKWTVNNGASILGDDNKKSVQVTAGGQNFTLTLTISYANTSISSTECKFDVIVVPCGGYCTYTQGKYGNKSPACDGDGIGDGTAIMYPTVVDMIKAMLGVGGVPNPLVIGSNGKFITIPATATAAVLLNASMPGGSTPRELFGSCTVDNLPSLPSCWKASNNQLTSYITKQGRINNVLLSQTITLGLNSRVSAGLSGFALQGGTFATAKAVGVCGSTTPVQRSCYYNELGVLVVLNEYTYKTISQTVIDALTVKRYSHTVGGLYQLANDALGNADGIIESEAGATLSNINDAVSAINEGFDECRISIGWNIEPCAAQPAIVTRTVTGNIPAAINAPELRVQTVANLHISAYPNPFAEKVSFAIVSPVSGKATLEVYNMFGQKLQTVYDGYLAAGKTQLVEYRPGSTVAAGTLVYKLSIGGKQVTGKLVNLK